MKAIKIVIGILGGALIIAGFLSWRLNFKLPMYKPSIYILAGIVAIAALIWGRLMGMIIMFVGLAPVLFGTIFLIFIKGMRWQNVKATIIPGILGIIAGAIFYMLGSPSVERSFWDRSEARGKAIVCASCNQYLGRARSFQSPCPRCGSNRWEYED